MIQMSINWWMAKKKSTACLCNGILFGHKMEWNSDTCNDIDKLWKNYVKQKKSVTEDHMLHDFIYMQCPEQASL